MNNWDNRPYIEVVLGNIGAEYIESYCKDTVAPEGYTRYTNVELPDAVYFITHKDEGITDPTIANALVCLADHVDNTDIDSWMDIQGDHCVDELGWLWVTEKYGVYHAQGIDVKVWYLEA